jgi:hypothetical protein
MRGCKTAAEKRSKNDTGAGGTEIAVGEIVGTNEAVGRNQLRALILAGIREFGPAKLLRHRDLPGNPPTGTAVEH